MESHEARPTNEMRKIKDPIHDYIIVSPQLSRIIDTKQFQRLRYIKQLGTSYFVWPGASHNRFEHCLGVSHLARMMIQHFRQEQPELNITDRELNCVVIAAACHDLGHGPWSHVWDSLYIPTMMPGKVWKHEDASIMMFKYLLRDNEINYPEEDVKFILALIEGDPTKCSLDEKPFLFDIVANKRNGLDVDKFDYIARDSYMIGEPTKISLTRLITSARVIDNEICYDIKDVNQLHEICYTRFRLHKMIYNHKTAKAIEYMIIDGLKKAESYMKIADRIEDPKKFLHLTDDIMGRIESSEDAELESAQEIFDRIRRRDLYKLVDYLVIAYDSRAIYEKGITAELIVEEARRLAVEGNNDIDLTDLTADCVIVDHSPMHYGMKDKNPLDFIKFYSKRNFNTSAHAQPGDYSMLMPPVFAEVYLTILTKHPQHLGLIQAGYRVVLERVQNPPTPTEPPSTPTREGTRSMTSIARNPFTAVPIDFNAASPNRKPASRDSSKRTFADLDGNSGSIEEDERNPKRRA